MARKSVRMGTEGLMALVSSLAIKSLCCVLGQDTLSPAKYWFNPGRPPSRHNLKSVDFDIIKTKEHVDKEIVPTT